MIISLLPLPTASPQTSMSSGMASMRPTYSEANTAYSNLFESGMLDGYEKANIHHQVSFVHPGRLSSAKS